jgi:hypothetical protein
MTMKSLLMKDVLAQKPNLILGALYSLLFFVAFGLLDDGLRSGFVYVFSGVAVGYTILLGSFKLDVNDTPRFMFSLPISRATAVNEKFVLLALATLYGTICAALFGALFSIPAIGWANELIAGVDLLRIVAGMTILSFMIPLYFKVGHSIIRYVLIIGLVLLVAGQIGGMLLVTFRGGPGRSIPILDFLFEWMTGGGDAVRSAAIAAAGLLIAAVSYLASSLIWRRKDI